MRGAFAVSSPDKLVLDDSEWPIIKMTLPANVSTVTFDELYGYVFAMAKRGPHIQWTDIRRVNPLSLPANVRRHAAELEKKLIAQAHDRVLADVRIVDGKILRGVLTAFEWLVGGAPWPVKNVADPEHAYAWLLGLGLIRGTKEPAPGPR